MRAGGELVAQMSRSKENAVWLPRQEIFMKLDSNSRLFLTFISSRQSPKHQAQFCFAFIAITPRVERP